MPSVRYSVTDSVRDPWGFRLNLTQRMPKNDCSPGANNRATRIILKHLNNLLLYPAASRSVWCRGAGFFYARIESSEGEVAAITIGTNKLIIIDRYI